MFPHAIRGIFVLGVASLIISVPAIAAAAQAPRVTIQDLQKNWKRYDGKVVRIRGQIDNCRDWCAICPETMTTETYDANRCMSLEFGPEDAHGKLVDKQPTLTIEQAYRFATITIEARFSSECLFDQNGTPVRNGVCVVDELPPNLREARVRQVHARKSARDGLVDYVIAPLKPALPEDRDAMMAEFNAVVWGDYATPEMFTTKLPIGIISDRDRGEVYFGDGLGCVCLDDSCEGRWPTRLFTGMTSAGNPFHCWQMIRTQEGWRVVPNFLQ